MLFGGVVDGMEGAGHDQPQPVVDLLLGPGEGLQRLHPLEVGDGDAAGVGENVGKNQDAAVEQDRVGLGQGRSVRRLGDQAGPDPRRIGGVDLRLQRRRDQDVAIELEQRSSFETGSASR